MKSVFETFFETFIIVLAIICIVFSVAAVWQGKFAEATYMLLLGYTVSTIKVKK